MSASPATLTTSPPASTTSSAAVSFQHLVHLSDDIGVFECTAITTPQREKGYCVDDVARAFVVAARQPEPSAEVTGLAATYLSFVLDAQADDGAFRNRRAADASWSGEPGVDDAWGRALWALGTGVARTPELVDWRALEAFTLGAALRSPSTRSMAFAGLGAAEVLAVRPNDVVARTLLADAATIIAPPDPLMGRRATQVEGWHWPEPRLSYANAALAETLIAAGSLLGTWKWLTQGLAMLSWLVETETTDGLVSVCPASGWGIGETRAPFGEEPTDVASLADACARAFDVTADPRWSAALGRCAAWFDGANASGTALHDAASGGACDGLEEGGRSENQGAVATTAMISTFQQAHRLGVAARV